MPKFSFFLISSWPSAVKVRKMLTFSWREKRRFKMNYRENFQKTFSIHSDFVLNINAAIMKWQLSSVDFSCCQLKARGSPVYRAAFQAAITPSSHGGWCRHLGFVPAPPVTRMAAHLRTLRRHCWVLHAPCPQCYLTAPARPVLFATTMRRTLQN